MNLKKFFAEFIGTFILVFLAVGAARVSGVAGMDLPGVAMAFGFALIGAAYGIGSISGCQINPAVSLGAFVSGRMTVSELIQDVIAQFAGAIVAAAILFYILGNGPVEGTAVSGANGFGDNSMYGVGMLQAGVFEFVATFLFVLVILGSTGKAAPTAMAGLAIGLVLIAIHLVGIPITGTSVNPARSFGPALFAGADAMGQVWVFLVFPALGGVAAGVVSRMGFLHPDD